MRSWYSHWQDDDVCTQVTRESYDITRQSSVLKITPDVRTNCFSSWYKLQTLRVLALRTMASWLYKRFVVIAIIDYTLNPSWYLAAMVAGGFPFVLQRVLNLYCFVHVYYRVWGVAAVKCTVSLWIGMALNIWVCDGVPKIRCVPLWCVWVWYIVYICHYAYSYLASGPTQLSVASSVVKWEVTYCIIVETFEGENSHKFEILLLFVAIW